MQSGPIFLMLVKYDGLWFKIYLLLILKVNLLPTLSSRFFQSKSDTHGMSVIMRCKNNQKPRIYFNRSLSTNSKKGSIMYLSSQTSRWKWKTSVTSLYQAKYVFYLNIRMITISYLVSMFNTLRSKQTKEANVSEIFPYVTATYWWS